MELIFQDITKRKIEKIFNYPFQISKEDLYLIEISARARSERQIGEEETDDDDLRIEINSRKFPQLNNPTRYFDSPAAFNGGRLHNCKKTVIFLHQLSKGNHTLTLIPDREPFLEEIKTSKGEIKEGKLTLGLDRQAEDGDRRPWYTFAFIDLPLKEITLDLSCQRRKWDKDDVKIIIDGEIKRNLKEGILHKFWYWVGSFLKGGRQTDTFEVDLKKGVHYIELWADRMPILNQVILDFGDTLLKRIPTVYDPKWIGDFYDDPEDVLVARLIFGEARGEPKEAKIWIAGSILNRVKAEAWPDTIHDVILQPGQYDPFKLDDPNYPKIIDPLKEISESETWQECYEIARDIISGQIPNPTSATHFYGGTRPEWFFKTVVPQGKFLRKIGNTYFYWSSN